jgi:hypothetical protein
VSISCINELRSNDYLRDALFCVADLPQCHSSACFCSSSLFQPKIQAQKNIQIARSSCCAALMGCRGAVFGKVPSIAVAPVMPYSCSIVVRYHEDGVFYPAEIVRGVGNGR